MSTRLSLAWTFLAQILAFLVTFASSIVVARLVSPRDFGIFGMAVAITAIISVALGLGLAKYIMREEKLEQDTLRTLFTINVLLGLCYVAMILAGAAFAYYVSRSPEVGQFLLVFALFPVISVFEFVPNALCARNMRFGFISAVLVLRAIVLATTTISLAWLGFAYMSFAWATIAAASVTAIVFNIACWRPDVWKPRLAGARKILHFGADMIGIGGLNQLSTRGGEMALGSILGLANLGLYARASSLPTTLYSNIYNAASNVIFSRLSRDLRDTGSFHDSYLRFMRIMLGVLWPAMLGMAVLAYPLVHLLYGEKWLGAATPLSLLMLAAATTLAFGMNSEVFILRHRTRQQVKIETVRAVLGFALFVGGAMISLVAAAAAKLAEAVIAYLLYRRPLIHLIGDDPGGLRAVHVEALLLSLAATLPATLLMLWHRGSPETPLLQILGAIALGAASWAVLLHWRTHPIAEEVWRLVRLLPSRNRITAA